MTRSPPTLGPYSNVGRHPDRVAHGGPNPQLVPVCWIWGKIQVSSKIPEATSFISVFSNSTIHVTGKDIIEAYTLVTLDKIETPSPGNTSITMGKLIPNAFNLAVVIFVALGSTACSYGMAAIG